MYANTFRKQEACFNDYKNYSLHSLRQYVFDPFSVENMLSTMLLALLYMQVRDPKQQTANSKEHIYLLTSYLTTFYRVIINLKKVKQNIILGTIVVYTWRI
jgi:hypothetical protein